MSIASVQVPGIYRRRVGEVLVTAIKDGSVVLPPEALLGITPEDRESLLRAAGRRPPFHSSITCYLLQWPERTVLVDTGVGTTWGAAGGMLPAYLKAAGVEPGEINDVVMTHLHVDHIGGLLTDAGAPAFPGAGLWVAEDEIAFWQDDKAKAAAPADRQGSFDGARKATRPYADRMHRFSYGEIMPGLAAVPLPGHTPGHTGYLVSSGGEKLLIWGDVFHVPAVQIARPDVGTGFDSDPALAIQSRREALERAAAEDLVVAGMHLDFPGFSRISRTANAMHRGIDDE